MPMGILVDFLVTSLCVVTHELFTNVCNSAAATGVRNKTLFASISTCVLECACNKKRSDREVLEHLTASVGIYSIT